MILNQRKGGYRYFLGKVCGYHVRLFCWNFVIDLGIDTSIQACPGLDTLSNSYKCLNMELGVIP